MAGSTCRNLRRSTAVRDVPLVSISDASASRCRRRNWVGDHPSRPAGRAAARRDPRREPSYLAFLGRISPEKRVDRAIAIAGRGGMPLKIAAKVDRADQDYFEREIQPAAATAACRVHRRDRRRREGRLPRRRAGAALPDRLAGAVRPGDDRGDGLRHAGDRLRPRLGAGSHRGRLTGFIVDDVDEAVARGDRLPRTVARGGAPAVRAALHRAPHGARTMSRSTSAWSAPSCRRCGRSPPNRQAPGPGVPAGMPAGGPPGAHPGRRCAIAVCVQA